MPFLNASPARVIVNRLNTHLDSTFAESQCGFLELVDAQLICHLQPDKYTRNTREKNLDLYISFVDVTKNFDTVSRKGLWKLLLKAGYPPNVIKIIRSLHDGMTARVSDLGITSEAFPVINGTKQGCVMASTPMGWIYLTCMEESPRAVQESQVCLEIKPERM